MITRDRRAARDERHRRLRRWVRGSATRPRLVVFRSLSHIYAQLIDDDGGKTLRGGYKYHGRVKALADAARAGGLDF